ncbi:MAG: ABC transporter permease [Candidatus Cyclobacteriaceae bacterium M3_2C_046]
MIKNYFITAWRSLTRHKFFSFINIFSLGLSMSISLLIILMLADQKQYDHFHDKKDRIYRVITKSTFGFSEYATAPLPIIEELKSFEGIEHSVQLINSIGGDAIYQQKATEVAGFYTTPSFFEIFSFELSQGNPVQALNDPYSMVITPKAAQKLFGTTDVLGKNIYFEEKGLNVIGFGSELKERLPLGAFTITGLIKNPPYKSHIDFDILVSASTIASLENTGIKTFPLNNWDTYAAGYTYLLFKEGHQADHLMPLLQQLGQEKYDGKSARYKLSFSLQALSQITPGKLLQHPITLRMPLVIYYVFLAFALLIILIACFNYTNLSVARAMTRAKEVGIRKVTGASRIQLLMQFLGESVLVALISLVFAIFLLMLLKPAFMNLWVNQYLNFDLHENISVYLIFVVFAVFIGIIAGLFPGLYLSKFQPSAVLTNFLKIKPTNIPIIKKLSLYKLLVVFQFSVALLFIISAILVYKQVDYFINMDYGFQMEKIVNVDLQGQSFDKVKYQFSNVPGVEEIAGTDYILTGPSSNTTYVNKGLSEQEEQYNFVPYHIDKAYIKTLGIALVAGQMFPEPEQGNQEMILINEQAVKRLGYEHPHEVIGLSLFASEGDETYKVIGVVRDFVHNLVFAAIDNVMLRYKPDEFQYAVVKLHQNSTKSSLAAMQTIWKDLDPVHPFKYDFFEEQVTSSYQILGDVTKIIGFVSFLAIMISCFGLLGITTFTTETRIKEVGVRKVLGAKVWQINWLLSQNFIILLSIAVLIAAPLAYYLNNLWLLSLAHRVNFNLGMVIYGVLIMLILGVGTIILQTTRIARVNPVNSLRSE